MRGAGASSVTNFTASQALSSVRAPASAVLQRLLSPDAMVRAEAVHAESNEPIESVATRLGLVSEQSVAKGFADAAQLPLLDASDFPKARVGDALPTAAFLRDIRALPVAFAQGRLSVALANPFDDFAVAALGYSFTCPVDRAVAPASGGFPREDHRGGQRLSGGGRTAARTARDG